MKDPHQWFHSPPIRLNGVGDTGSALLTENFNKLRCNTSSHVPGICGSVKCDARQHHITTAAEAMPAAAAALAA